MKIGLICNEYPPRPHGGIGSFIHAMAHAMSAQGHSVTVFELGKAAGERSDQNVRVLTVLRSTSRGIADHINRHRLRKAINREVRAGRVDIVETQDWQGMIPNRVACPVVVRLIGTDTMIASFEQKPVRRSMFRFERRQLTTHRNWITPTDWSLRETQRLFPGVSPSRCAQTPNPTADDVPTSPQIELPDTFILAAGHVTARKGALDVATAARIFLERHSELHVVFAGKVLSHDGRPCDEVISEMLGPELSKRCHFPGFVPHGELLGSMQRAQALLAMSPLETFGLTATEAMFQRCPVIANRNSAFREFVSHEQTGLLVDAKDAHDVADAVSRVLTDKSSTQEVVTRAYESATELFSASNVAERTVAFYEQCLANEVPNTSLSIPERSALRAFGSTVLTTLDRVAPNIRAAIRAKISRRHQLVRRLRRETNGAVYSGPFAGMKYDRDNGYSFLPKLIGSFEQELHEPISRLLKQSFQRVVNIGSAEGYYAVGLARALPDAQVDAYDIEPTPREQCVELARQNGVSDRLHQHEGCDLPTLAASLVDDSLIVCDCEGYEVELLQPEVVPTLETASIVVELHEHVAPGSTQLLTERFQSTHDVRIIEMKPRSPKQFDVLRGLNESDLHYCLDEGRIYEGEALQQTWAVMTPRMYETDSA